MRKREPLHIENGMGRRTLLIFFVLLSGSRSWTQTASTLVDEVRALTRDLPFAMPAVKVPAFPERQMNIVNYGAVPDGHTMNTGAFAAAVEACAKAGGGMVLVPPGTWLTGPIKLQSNVNLHLERGALIQFSKRVEDFPLIAGLDGTSKRYIVTPPIHAYEASNIAITGHGVIDGAGEVWRYVKKEKQTARQWKELTGSGGVVTSDGKEWWPSKEAMEGEEYLKGLEKSSKRLTAEDYARAKEFLRPDLVRLVRCTGVLLDGPTFQNSPKFHVHPVQSDDIIVRDVKIFTEWYAQNGDGLDLNSCRNVVVYNTTVNVGDDGICIKPGTPRVGKPACENIVIADCQVYHAHGGFVVGSESYGGARNISVRNCLFMGTDVGIRFKSARGRGGLVENIYIDGVRMRAIENEAILFDMYYGEGSPEVETAMSRGERRAMPVDARTPCFQNVTIKHIVCDGARHAVLLKGLPEMPVKNIMIDSISVSSERGVLAVDVETFEISNSVILSQSAPVIVLHQSRDVIINLLRYRPETGVFMQVEGKCSDDIHVRSVNETPARSAIEVGAEVKPDAVEID